MTQNFITAEAARILSGYSRTFDALVIEAERAIMEATRKAVIPAVSIDYTKIDPETDKRFHDFLIEKGFRVNIYHLDINRMQTQLRISWF